MELEHRKFRMFQAHRVSLLKNFKAKLIESSLEVRREKIFVFRWVTLAAFVRFTSVLFKNFAKERDYRELLR